MFQKVIHITQCMVHIGGGKGSPIYFVVYDFQLSKYSVRAFWVLIFKPSLALPENTRDPKYSSKRSYNFVKLIIKGRKKNHLII